MKNESKTDTYADIIESLTKEQKGKLFLSKSEKEKFMAQFRLDLYNIDLKKREIDQKQIEIEKAKKQIKEAQDLIEYNTSWIERLHNFKKAVEQEVYNKQTKIIVMENETLVKK